MTRRPPPTPPSAPLRITVGRKPEAQARRPVAQEQHRAEQRGDEGHLPDVEVPHVRHLVGDHALQLVPVHRLQEARRDRDGCVGRVAAGRERVRVGLVDEVHARHRLAGGDRHLRDHVHELLDARGGVLGFHRAARSSRRGPPGRRKVADPRRADPEERRAAGRDGQGERDAAGWTTPAAPRMKRSKPKPMKASSATKPAIRSQVSRRLRRCSSKTFPPRGTAPRRGGRRRRRSPILRRPSRRRDPRSTEGAPDPPRPPGRTRPA